MTIGWRQLVDGNWLMTTDDNWLATTSWWNLLLTIGCCQLVGWWQFVGDNLLVRSSWWQLVGSNWLVTIVG